MSERYLPASEFLNYVIAGEIAFENSPLAEANLRELLKMVDDPDRSNRDWAAFVISALPLDTPAIRDALVKAADGDDPDTRDEAIIGLARRDRAAALARLAPLLEEELGVVLLEAAAILGDPSLVPALREIENWKGGGDEVREQLHLAITACERGVGVDSWPDSGERAYCFSDGD
jgi:HEAT repeat protein